MTGRALAPGDKVRPLASIWARIHPSEPLPLCTILSLQPHRTVYCEVPGMNIHLFLEEHVQLEEGDRSNE
jgi:hypothetical protein